MRTVYELIEATQKGIADWDYWLKLEAEIDAFWEHPDTTDAQRDLLRKEGYLEMMGMICSGYRYSEQHKAQDK